MNICVSKLYLYLTVITIVFSGIDFKSCEIEVAIDKQSDEISNGVHRDKHEDDIGAGDQVRTTILNKIDTTIG